MDANRTSADATSPALADEAAPPHRDLYTRLQVSGDGIGMFAIRDIPAGTVLFAGDRTRTVRVSVGDVDKIDDAEIKRMYVDFCPVIDGAFVAPENFNQLTMGWYLNHSDDPNVAGGKDLVFTACKPIKKGEELRVDYTTYSERALSRQEALK